MCLLVKNTGEPICYKKAHCNPDLNPEPVCGTDGITYSDICAMRLSRNRQGQSPDLAHKGSCGMNLNPMRFLYFLVLLNLNRKNMSAGLMPIK